jgi:hypothetical protein
VIVTEGDARASAGPAIFVGATGAARAAGIDAGALAPEEWIVRTTVHGLLLCGGRPRGTLYAVYHFLEDRVGVRWWSQYEEFVPRRRRLEIGPLDRRGVPAFSYREISLLDGTFPFCVRNRLNGNETRVPPDWGDHIGYATPWRVHSFDHLVSPEREFAAHPEYFAERAGFRSGTQTQLCLTQPAVSELVAREIAAIAEREKAGRGRAPARTLYDVSHNDWGGWCRCAACEAVRAREGSEAGTLLPVVNRAAAALAAVDPSAFVTTLAYTYTFRPPRDARPRDNVIVELTGWGKRDFARPAADPANASFREALFGWGAITRHLWIWEYTFSMGASELGLPFPTYRSYADDLRLYKQAGADGVIVQTSYQVPGDLRDLNVWLLAKLIENPDLDEGALIRDFVDGFYGKAAGPIRGYMTLLEKATDPPPRLVAETSPSAYTFLDAPFIVAAQRWFDQAERAVRRDHVLARRVRHARVSLDYATLVLWPKIAAGAGGALDRRRIAARYESTLREQIEMRVPSRARQDEWRRIEDEREDETP